MEIKNTLLKLSILLIPLSIPAIRITRSYFTDTAVIAGNLISTGKWEKEIDIELKKPLDDHTYFLDNEIQILWKLPKKHPHSDFTFKLFLLDEEGEKIEELDLDGMDCGPPDNSDVHEKWCKWKPKESGNYKIRVEASSENGDRGSDENLKSFTIEKNPSKNKGNTNKNKSEESTEENISILQDIKNETKETTKSTNSNND